jgi:Wzt-like putative exopolysaccharide export protein
MHDIDTAVVVRLRERNAVDLALCAWAREQFLDRRRHGATAHPHLRLVIQRAAADFGNRQIVMVSSRGERADGGAVITSSDRIRVTLCGHASIDEPALTAGIAVRNRAGDLVYATNTYWLGKPLRVAAHATFRWDFLVPPLPGGTYDVTLALHKGVSHLEGCYHWLEGATSLVVMGA